MKKYNFFRDVYYTFWKNNTPEQRLNTFLGLLFFGWLIILFFIATGKINDIFKK